MTQATEDVLNRTLSADDRALRDEIRSFLDTHLTDELRLAGRLCAGIYCDRPVAQRWLSILNDRGWATPAWPVAYGGTGWNLVQHAIFARELSLAEAPPVTPNATGMLGPVLIEYGTPAQKARFLKRIQSGEDWWAQGYSEPQAGSDLARLGLKAERRGDVYVLNGSKIWTTHAHWSNRMFALVRTRTDGKAQEGISFLLLDLDLPGITISPIISISGDHELNQVFFENVHVPVEGLVGEENAGWTVAKFLLKHERGGQYAPRLRNAVRQLKAMARARGVAFANARIDRAEIALDVLEAMEFRILAATARGAPLGAYSSMMKVQGTELRQLLDEIALELAGDYAAPSQTRALHTLQPNDGIGPPDILTTTTRYLNDRAASIYAGSNEVQRNIMAGQQLGL
ncbi:MAG: acyl-CoA dehydrogenase family protein [Alphaproteobacteria bacterium]|nr:acyl-CoA dehydrogenase family protein [Alphaproteobacteria bacterium]